MEKGEALAGAITTFKLQGADLSGIIRDGGGRASLDHHPIIEAVRDLKTAIAAVNVEPVPKAGPKVSAEVESDFVSALDWLQISCSEGESNNLPISERHGGEEALVGACKALTAYNSALLELALAVLCANLTDTQSREKFRFCSGPQVVCESLSVENARDKILRHGSAVVAAASLKHEDAKDIFVLLKVPEVLLNQLKKHHACPGGVQGECDALQSLVAADDDRSAVSPYC